MPKSQLDWLGIASLWLGTAIMALKAASLPMIAGAPTWLAADLWSYIPLVLVTIYAAIALYRQLRPGRPHAPEVASSPIEAEEEPDPDFLDKLKIVRGKTFRNCEVLLDGHYYTRCDFENVTIVHKGGPYASTDNVFGPGIHIKAGTPALGRYTALLLAMGYLRTPVVQDDSGRPVTADEFDKKHGITRGPRPSMDVKGP